MIKIGQKVKFNTIKDPKLFGFRTRCRFDTGKVVYINKPHRWFCVEYFVNDHPVRICFKFDQIGTDVKKI